ncbi:MAG: adenylyltransferase/cytidyltransferase family protein [Campylobacteraceae bacterium]|jgi:[citrate (pro-3S)-lyase] ligase|nr:adenylyltransferase/cytidyltransferase family protein [Campylobacteraceae bacterium]
MKKWDRDYVRKKYGFTYLGLNGIYYPCEKAKRLMVLFSSMGKDRFDRYSWFWQTDEIWIDTAYLFIKDDSFRYFLGTDEKPMKDSVRKTIQFYMTKCNVTNEQVFCVGGSMGGYSAIYFALYVGLRGAIVCNPQVSYRAAQMHEYANWERYIREIGSQWYDLDVFYHKYGSKQKPALYLEYGDYMADKQAAESLISSLIKQECLLIVRKTKWTGHTVNALLKQTIENAINYFEKEPIAFSEQNDNSILSIQKTPINKNIEKIVAKLQAISSFNYSIFEWFKEKGIHEISIFGTQNDVQLLKWLQISNRYTQDFNIKHYLSDSKFVCDSPVLSLNFAITYNELNTNITLKNSDTILVCSTSNGVVDNIKKQTQAQIVCLLNIIDEIFIKKLIIEPFLKLQNEQNIKVLFCSLPLAKNIKAKSENEISLENINIFTIIEEMAKSQPIAPLALTRFGDSIKYVREITSGWTTYLQDNIMQVSDCSGDYVNVINGHRLTTNQQNNYKNSIYIFGNSIVFGTGAEDNETICSNLQRLVNRYSSESYCVMNCANFSADNYDYGLNAIKKTHFKDGDIVVFATHLQDINNIIKDNFIICLTQHAFERPHDMGEVFVDNRHLNKIGYAKIAELLFQTMLDNNLFNAKTKTNTEMSKINNEDSVNDYFKTEVHTKDVKVNNTGNLNDCFEAKSFAKNPNKPSKSSNPNTTSSLIPKQENENLKKYKELLLKNKTKTTGKIGSIVMNCNPFTLGHRYLIEQSLKKVNHLYIFVVEEDKSFFPFKDRFELVKEGTKDLKNITMIPSGRFIISSLTFEAYSNKEKLQDETIDASNDVNIFAEEIAPILNINIRFAGEEPLDNITRQYNNTMRMILPKYNIDFEVIKRKESDNEPISASRVRKLLKNKNFDEIAKIVPKSTFEYLAERFGDSAV